MIRDYSIDVLVNNKPVTTYTTPNNRGEIFVEGRPGSKYQIRVTNHSYQRIKAIVSVDGLSVLDGEPAGTQSKGYIIESKGSVIIDGWRTSLNTVAEFVFGGKSKSYSAKSGQGTRNTGVIGLMVFQEQPVYYDYSGIRTIDNTSTWNNTIIDIDNTSPLVRMGVGVSDNQPVAMTASFGGNAVPRGAPRCVTASVNNVGTEFGQEQTSHSREVTFTSKSHPTYTGAIYYDDRKGLEARGIVVDTRYQRPDPFPASNSFCRPV